MDLELLSGMETRPDDFAWDALQSIRTANAEPGAWQVYGNSGYHLVSLAMERVTGASFAELMQDRLFAPTGMNQTAIAPSAHQVTRGLASHYVARGDGGWVNFGGYRTGMLGTGGGCSTVADMLTWAKALRESDPRLPAEHWTALKTPAPLADGSAATYGLGLTSARWRGLTLVGHGGSLPGAESMLLTVPEHGLDVVVLDNGGFPVDSIARAIIAGVLGEAALANPAVGALTENFHGLVGRTFVSPDFVIGFADLNGGLGLSYQGAPPFLMNEADHAGAAMVVQGATGRIEIALPSGPGGQEVPLRMGGQTQVCERASLNLPSRLEIAAEAAGAYVCEELDSRIELSLADNRLKVETFGRHGRSAGEATPIAADVLRFATPDVISLIRLRRVSGRVSSIDYNTARTRRLPFNRVA
jgi:hypothetical protein